MTDADRRNQWNMLPTDKPVRTAAPRWTGERHTVTQTWAGPDGGTQKRQPSPPIQLADRLARTAFQRRRSRSARRQRPSGWRFRPCSCFREGRAAGSTGGANESAPACLIGRCKVPSPNGVCSARLAGLARPFSRAHICLVAVDRRPGSVRSPIIAGRFAARDAQRACGSSFEAAARASAANDRGLSPAADEADMLGWLMRALGQAYILGRHHFTLLVYASETSLFQRMLASAPHTATAAHVWPAAVPSLVIAAPPRVS